MDIITTYKAHHISQINPPTAIHQTQNKALWKKNFLEISKHSP